MARFLLALLLLSACSAAPGGTSQYEDPSKGFEAAGSAGEGVHTVHTPEAGSGGAQSLSPLGGSGGTGGVHGVDTLAGSGGTGGLISSEPPAGSGGVTTNDTPGGSGGLDTVYTPGGSGGQSGTAGLGSVYQMCGDGTCTSFEMPGSIAPCSSDCTGQCGNGILEPQDQWACPNDGTPKPVPVVLCPFPVWVWDSSANTMFVNPYHAGAKQWQPGDRVQRAGSKCYQCTALGCDGDPVSDFDHEFWTVIDCGC